MLTMAVNGLMSFAHWMSIIACEYTFLSCSNECSVRDKILRKNMEKHKMEEYISMFAPIVGRAANMKSGRQLTLKNARV
jgi:hypothetical protein